MFVYGPLMADEAVKALLGRNPPSRTAILDGYIRCCQKGAETAPGICTTHRSLVRAGYPAVARGASSDFVEGILLENLRSNEMQALDYYEDPSYKRQVVKVRAPNAFGGEEELEALVYCVPIEGVNALDANAQWHYKTFRAQHMTAFIDQVIKPCRAGFEREQGVLEGQMSQRSQQPSAR